MGNDYEEYGVLSEYVYIIDPCIYRTNYLLSPLASRQVLPPSLFFSYYLPLANLPQHYYLPLIHCPQHHHLPLIHHLQYHYCLLIYPLQHHSCPMNLLLIIASWTSSLRMSASLSRMVIIPRTLIDLTLVGCPIA